MSRYVHVRYLRQAHGDGRGYQIIVESSNLWRHPPNFLRASLPDNVRSEKSARMLLDIVTLPRKHFGP